jgi:hypothetical protein
MACVTPASFQHFSDVSSSALWAIREDGGKSRTTRAGDRSESYLPSSYELALIRQAVDGCNPERPDASFNPLWFELHTNVVRAGRSDEKWRER